MARFVLLIVLIFAVITFSLFILKCIPGSFVGLNISVFFLPEWLDKSLDILETFPKAGKVTALPIVGGDTTVISRQSYLEALNDEKINIISH